VLLTAAYLGFDKSEKFQSAFETIAPDVARQLEKAKSALIGLDTVETDTYVLDPEYGIYWQYMICYITGINHRIEDWRKCYILYFFFRRQKHVPLLNYFRRRWDVPIVGALLFVFLTTFIYLVALTLDFDLPTDSRTLRCIFFAYVIGIVWVLFSLIILHGPLQNIDKTCEKGYVKIATKMDNAIRRAAKIQQKLAQRASSDSTRRQTS